MLDKTFAVSTLTLALALPLAACAVTADSPSSDSEPTTATTSEALAPTSSGVTGRSAGAVGLSHSGDLAPSSRVSGLNPPTGSGDTPTCADDVELQQPGGATLSAVRIAHLYWGSYWSTAAGKAEAWGQTSAWSKISSSPKFYGVLAEYFPGGLTGQWEDARTLYGSLSSTTTKQLTKSDIEAELQKEITDFTVPSVPYGRVPIYVIYLPPGVAGPDLGGGYWAYHDHFTANGTYIEQGSDKTVPVYYAVIIYNGLGADAVPGGWNVSESHELYETITDPNINSGFRDTKNGYGEVGDLCNQQGTPFMGHTIQTDWSQKACACIAAVDPGVSPPGGGGSSGGWYGGGGSGTQCVKICTPLPNGKQWCRCPGIGGHPQVQATNDVGPND